MLLEVLGRNVYSSSTIYILLLISLSQDLWPDLKSIESLKPHVSKQLVFAQRHNAYFPPKASHLDLGLLLE